MIKNDFLLFPDKKYQIIYADPPWSYKNKKTGGSMSSGSSLKYPAMSLEEIKSLPIQKIADKNSVLFLWITVPLLPDGLEVLKVWGYKYKTSLFWRKIMSLGMGFWFRGQVEILLMGIKGKTKAFRIQKSNFIQAKVQKHSQKPKEFRELINKIELYPRIELFARPPKNLLFEDESYKGWDLWGNEV